MADYISQNPSVLVLVRLVSVTGGVAVQQHGRCQPLKREKLGIRAAESFVLLSEIDKHLHRHPLVVGIHGCRG
ncbi:hypothetical protein LDENG_00251120 [Lucifuga dentata]|nr:hypothetical protein LDENG_00251120 [Lucifuga dentata]